MKGPELVAVFVAVVVGGGGGGGSFVVGDYGVVVEHPK